jgi:hypothetical protein
MLQKVELNYADLAKTAKKAPTWQIGNNLDAKNQ